MTEKKIYECLKKVIDPELYVDIVSLGLIYEVEILRPSGSSQRSKTAQDDSLGAKSLPSESSGKVRKKSPRVKILMTLTSPGCPLAGSFDFLLRDALSEIERLDVKEDVEIELTFDPPWTADLMTDEVKAELGFD